MAANANTTLGATANVSNVHTYLHSIAVPSSVANGTPFRTTIVSDAMYGNRYNLYLRFGPNANNSDQIIYAVNGQYALNCAYQFMTVLTANGNTGSITTCSLSPVKLDFTGPVYLKSNTAAVNSNLTNYLGVSFGEDFSVQGNTVFNAIVIEQIK